MRLLRIGEPATKVAADVRAGLTALGRGSSDLGGIALVDVRPLENGPAFESVLVTPHGIVIVAGIDLPGPALHLEAPLYGQWKADNWPLVSDGTAVNPASAALAAAEELTRRLNTLTNMAMPVGLVLAVGPFVERVTPENPENRYVRIVHPRPAALRAAIVDLVPQDGLACTAEQARAVLRTLDPTVPIQPDEVLKGEGFAVGVAAYAHAGAPALAEQATTTPMQPPAQGHKSNARGTAQKAKAAALAAAAEAKRGPQVNGAQRTPAGVDDDAPTDLMPLPLPKQASPQRGSQVRLLPIAAVLVVVAGLVAAIVMATSSSGSDEEPKPTPQAEQRPQRYAISGVEFTAVERWANDECQDLTYGDVQALIQKNPCSQIRLASYLATVSGKQAAVSLAEIEFDDPKHAKQLKELADKPGSGGAADAANMSEAWPEGKLTFHNALYRNTVEGTSVRLVRVAWVGEETSSDDKLLDRVAKTSFEVPVD